MPLNDIQATTYAGDRITVDGLNYVWNGSQYIFEEIIPSTNRKVTVPFYAILSDSTSTTNVNLLGSELEVYVDGVLWNGEEVLKSRNELTITFTENYLLQQRLITFKTQRGECTDRFAIKARVNSENDVVIIGFGTDEPIPTVGDYSAPTITNQYVEYSGYGGGGGGANTTFTTDINVANPDFIYKGFNDTTLNQQ